MNSDDAARFLERTFRDAIRANTPCGNVNLFLFAENTERILPAAIFEAIYTGQDQGVKYNGKYGMVFDLSVTCRVNAAFSSSADALSLLVSTMRAAVESATGVTGWDLILLHTENIKSKDSVDTMHREVTLTWPVTGIVSS